MSETNDSARATRFAEPGFREFARRARPYVAATLAIALASAIAPLLQRLPHANLSLLFMTAVLIVAVRYGLWPSIYASVSSFLIFNFLFTPPFLTLAVGEEGDVATLAFFLIMASLTGNLAARLRDAMANREAAVKRTASLQSLTRRVAGAATTEQVLESLAERLSEVFGCRVIAGLTAQRTGEGAAVAASGGGGETTAAIPDADAAEGWTLIPLRTVRGRIGTVAIRTASPTADELEYAEALIDQAAVAVERTLLVKDLEEAKLVSEREQVRAALLSSVSHDLRTPLSSIIGATSTLTAYGDTLKPCDKQTLLQSVQDEADRLDRHIQNLLDMTRLDRGQITLQRDWEDIRDLVFAASKRLHLVRHGVSVTTEIAPDAELVHVNGDLMEQVFVNLFDNCLCHATGSPRITVRASRKQDVLTIEVRDDGPGIPEAERERIFDPFYRIQERDRKHGSGLGLSICRGILQSHGGDVSAHAANGGGALIRMRMTQPESAADAAGR